MKEEKIAFRLTSDLRRALDDIRRAEPDLPNCGEMMRRLIQRAAASLGKETATKPRKK